MKTIAVQLSESAVKFIHSLHQEENEFAMDAIEEKIAREKRNALKELLAEGYQATRDEDLSITNDFQHADFENL